MKTVKQEYLINAPVKKVWQALVDPKIINKWGGGKAKMSDKVGFEFSLWNGDIHGKNLEVIPNKKLVQAWMSGNWEQYSKVKFSLSEKNGDTKIELIHENIPDEEAEDIADGWKSYYFNPMKKLLENS